jgi:hypothetical protein
MAILPAMFSHGCYRKKIQVNGKRIRRDKCLAAVWPPPFRQYFGGNLISEQFRGEFAKESARWQEEQC